MSDRCIQLKQRRIGRGQPCFVIAEAGVNHNGDPDLARQLVDIAAKAGADAVKFQTFKTERLVVPDAPGATYQMRGGVKSQFDLLKPLELSETAHRDLIDQCRARHIQFLSTPFEEESADLLVALGLELLKLPSGELTNLPFLRHVAEKNVPVILSTGMASFNEVRQAVEVFRATSEESLILLHCVSNYPADPADCNLRAMLTMENALDVPVGFSDHTEGNEIALAAVALGACVIEKHFTLDRNLPGPDHRASVEPDELAALVAGIRKVESALGHGRKERAASEQNTADVARKSIAAAYDIEAGAVIDSHMVAMRRPGTGLASVELPSILGRKTNRRIPSGTLLTREMLA